MKQIVLLMSLVLVIICGCVGSGNMIKASSNESKPKLHMVIEDGNKFLANKNGTLLYSLESPYVTIDVDRKVFIINPHVFYSPGTTYYFSSYDKFTASCGGHPQAGSKGVTLDFGPGGGEFPIPQSPDYIVCSFQAFIIDGEGTTFETDSYVTFFSRDN